MKDKDIIIYEKDSVDIKFTLDSNNSAITQFKAADKIVWALRQFNSGHAVLLKEKTGVTGNSVTFSLTKQDTEKLFAQRYVYDLAVLDGETLQNTVIKSAGFVVSNKQIDTKDSATISLDVVAEAKILVNEAKAYAADIHDVADTLNENVAAAYKRIDEAMTAAAQVSQIVDQVAGSASSASAAKEASAGYATQASGYATNASSSATAASGSASSASSSASTASSKATEASGYADAASSSASSASSSASTASTKADEASSSASAAASSATSAASSASSADSSASAAASDLATFRSEKATISSQIAGTTDSGLKTKIEANETAISTLESQMAGTTTSSLQEQIANLGLSVVNGELSITYNV